METRRSKHIKKMSVMNKENVLKKQRLYVNKSSHIKNTNLENYREFFRYLLSNGIDTEFSNES